MARRRGRGGDEATRDIHADAYRLRDSGDARSPGRALVMRALARPARLGRTLMLGDVIGARPAQVRFRGVGNEGGGGPSGPARPDREEGGDAGTEGEDRARGGQER